MAARASEVTGVARLLLADYESPEAAAKEIIAWLDQDRAKRKQYLAVMQFGERPGNCFYIGLGPYPGWKSAEKAARSHPAAGEAYKIAIVPTINAAGLAEVLRNIDTYTKPA